MVNLAMIQEDLITFETALLAKSKGFNKNKLSNWEIGYKFDNNDLPTQALLAKWLRDVHNIVIIIDYATHQDDEPIGHITYYCMINKFTPEIFTSSFDEGSEDDGITEYYDTYEQALEQGLQIALKLI